MKNSYAIFSLLVSVIIISSCDMIGQNHTTSETQRDVTLEETLWRLVNFQDENGQKSESGSSEITLILYEDGIVSGTSSSNEYESSYSKQNSKLDFQPAGTTKVGEPEGSKYMIYLSALKDVQFYEISSNELTLHYGEINNALIFEAIAMDE